MGRWRLVRFAGKGTSTRRHYVVAGKPVRQARRAHVLSRDDRQVTGRAQRRRGRERKATAVTKETFDSVKDYRASRSAAPRPARTRGQGER